MNIRELFDPSKKIDRRIEKVIKYDSTDPEYLRQEITEYVATESIESSFERLLDLLDEGMGGGGGHEIGVWVSGFYGSGKSSFTKYFGFALDPERTLDGKPFLEWLQTRFTSNTLRARIATVAKKYPATVIMLDLASEHLAGASMAEISSVLYWKVMQWAGYSLDKKIAYLQYMLEKDGKLAEFEAKIKERAKGKSFQEIQNQPLVVKTYASELAAELYPDIWPDAKAFNEIIVDEA
ncbi:MAG: BREX system P-loop protein BrxC, partial [Syntrophobacteraceae bacterium]